MSKEIQLLKIAQEALKSKKQIPIELYDEWASKLRIVQYDSSNHGCIGAICDLVNLYNGNKTVLSKEMQAEKAIAYLTGPLLDREAFCRGAYMRWGMDYMLYCRELWPRLSRGLIGDEATRCLNAIFAIFALVSAKVPAKILSGPEEIKPGPGVFEATIHNTDGKNYPSMAVCGARSANRKPEGTAGMKPPPGSVYKWRHLSPCMYSQYLWECLKKISVDGLGQTFIKLGMNPYWVGDDSLIDDLKKTYTDFNSIEILLRLINRARPKYRFGIIRTDTNVVMYMINGPDGSTANLDAVKINLETGRHLFAISNEGGRDAPGGKDTVKATKAWASRTDDVITIQCETVDDPKNVVTFNLTGDVILDVEFGQMDKDMIIHECQYSKWLDAISDKPDKEPPVPPKPEKKSWWKRIKEFFNNFWERNFEDM